MAFDPTGARHHGMPTYPYRMAPQGLATRRQLRNAGLQPARQPIAAQILWRKGKRVAYLYRIDRSRPKRPATPAQLAALAKANTVLRTCTTCQQTHNYIIPRRWGECLTCVAITSDTATPQGEPDMTTNNVVRVLRDAAAYVREHGYYCATAARDNFDWVNGKNRGPAASAEGAIAHVIYGYPVQMPTPEPTPTYQLFRQAINAYVDLLEDRDEFGTESTTAEGVAADLDDSAVLWEFTHDASTSTKENAA